MFNNHRTLILFGLASFGLGLLAGDLVQLTTVAEAQSAHRTFELRTYTAHPGRLQELHARFADHTLDFFERHGMTNVGYFGAQDAPLAENTLVYLLAHDSREAAEASWAAFRADADWQRVAEQTRRNGRLVQSIESVFLEGTDYSPLR